MNTNTNTDINIVLLEPEIPHNTGAIGRLCAATGTKLHLIRPLGFDVSEKAVKRAGLDYWQYIDIHYYDNFEYFERENTGVIYFATTKARKCYADVSYTGNGKGCYIVFGKESAGIPEELLMQRKDYCIRIPMLESMRSLNLAVSAGIVLYEALRQNSFSGLTEKGNLHWHSW